jgi:hypothetical protein
LITIRGPGGPPSSRLRAAPGSLITQKRADYLLFKQAIYLLNAKAKSNIEGFISILSLKASMNSGLSETLKIHFPTLIPVSRPVVSWEGIPDPF